MPTGRKKGNQKRTGRPIITNKGNNSKSLFFETAPGSGLEWLHYASLAGVTQRNLGQYNDFVSASKISQTQFLLLRTLIITRETDDFEPEAYQLEEKIAEAKELLERNRGFKAYLNAIKKDTGSGSSHFSEVRKHQLEVLWGRKDGGMLEKIDETPVNSSFIIFLRALESLVPDCKYWWRWSKHSFSVNFSKTKPKKGQKRRGYTAITDGQLQEYKSHEIKALIECKMDTRKSCKPAVDMQEAAQMVAWIKQYPSEERRYVIS